MKKIVGLLLAASSMSMGLQAVNPMHHFAAHALAEPCAEYVGKALGVGSVDLTFSKEDFNIEAMKQRTQAAIAALKTDPQATAQAWASNAPALLEKTLRLYCAYAAPQLIDSYVIKSSHKNPNGPRTTTQNIASFLGRHGHIAWNDKLTFGIRIEQQPLSKDLILRNLVAEIVALSVEY